ncbi:MAG: AraC family transcriptional regulator [Burkholderia gladioli]
MAPHIASDGHGIQATRHDFEGARDWMAHICGPHGLQVRRPGRVQFNHSGTVLRSMASTLGYVEYGTDVTISVDDGAPLNCYSISLPVTGQQALASRGRTWLSDAEKGVIVSPHETQALSINGNCRKIIVSVPRAALRQVLEGLLQRPLVEAIAFEPEMSAAAGEQGAWWRMVRFLTDEMERSGGWLNHLQMAGDLEQALLKGLLLAQPHNYSAELADALRPAVPHYVQLARQFIHAHAREDVTLEDIERAAGVSRQTLFAAFRQHVGQGPMAYLKRYRLEGVRRDMASDRSARNVSMVALGWGFTHLGRFSAEYKALFGETPSQTLKRRG